MPRVEGCIDVGDGESAAVPERGRLDEDVCAGRRDQIDSRPLGGVEPVTVGAELGDDVSGSATFDIEPGPVAAGADRRDQEPDAELSGQRSFAVADELAEALRDMPEPQDAESDVTHVGHGHPLLSQSARKACSLVIRWSR